MTLIYVAANGVGFHDLVFTASGEKRFLSDVRSLKTADKLLVRLHGAFMIAAWIGTASIGIVLARYFKQTWVESSLCAKDLWFAVSNLLFILVLDKNKLTSILQTKNLFRSPFVYLTFTILKL